MRGSHISGGQKQRVAVLRALFRRPRILLLDEATSALDPRNEEAVMAAVRRAVGGRTVLNVTHRLTTLRDYDRILVLRQGTIVERGTFEELMQKRGEFYELVNVKTDEQNEQNKAGNA
jgi:ABC-type multidrug transport system fused ATPase/permease subunit